MKQDTQKKNKLLTRPPIVVILGHTDHGKTSILDFVRKTKIAEKEAGGITQHTGAYQIEHQSKRITFIDTPGHEIFFAMRSRGAAVADIAVLVVASEEGVKPQTKEAIEHAKKAGIPIIAALNKIDKKEAQPEKVKSELAEHGVAVESMGGEVPSVNVSAKTGQGIDGLLEMISLVAEMEELAFDPEQPASGLIIESNCNSQRGATATVLVKAGVLHSQDIIGTDSACGRIKTLENFQFQSIDKAEAGTPAVVTGFSQPPQVGERLAVFDNLEAAQAKINPRKAEHPEIVDTDPDKKVLNIILKADVCGCLEAIKGALKSIPSDQIALRILYAGMGEVTESDIKLAESAKAKIVGFRAKTSAGVKRIAQQRRVKITTYDVVYELIQGVREMMSKLLAPEIVKKPLGTLKVLALFRSEKDRQIVGGKVIKGEVKRNAAVDVLREGEKIASGKAIQIQRNKKEVDEAARGQECGVLFKGPTVIEEKDMLEFYEEEKIARAI